MKLYVASPYRLGNKVENVEMSLRAGEALIKKGHVPFLPLLAHYWESHYYHEQDFWLNYDYELLSSCEGLVRLRGASLGADAEVEWAMAHQIPVYYGVEAVPHNENHPAWLA